ncbi:MAG: radical SAM protein [Brevinematia bacterium]
MKLLIIDGFVDEPTCLGVPPYLSTYIRYTAGAAFLAGIKEISYRTILQLRESSYIISPTDFAVIIAGNPVPGKYLGGKPIELYEIEEIAGKNKKTRIFIGGPIQFEKINFKNQNIFLIEKDIEAFIYDYFSFSKTEFRYRTIEELNSFAINGSFIVEQHPRHPDIIVEIETSRGCPRKIHCSFCIEGLYNPEFRKPLDIINEIKSLASFGIRHFRLGKQADIYSYMADMSTIKDGFPRPQPENLRMLYEGIRDNIPQLETLHLDNVNPGTIAKFPVESQRITEIIVKNNTAGDVAAMGMESADPVVVEKNFLKASPDEVYFAIRLINEIGGIREDGIPKLLPGLNFIKGLAGESRETFKKNYEFLKKVKDDGLLLRRINIRQLKISPHTYIASHTSKGKNEPILDAIFKKYREKIRNEIDNYMLKQIFPVGLSLKNLIVETNRGDWSLARQIGTYPITVNIPRRLNLLEKIDAFILSHRERSIVGLIFPFNLSLASLREIEQIPGVGKKATEFFIDRSRFINEIKNLPVYKLIKESLIE